tara:strand:- start:3 stop:407 length:405 start_codon:yes stop_codon:yes gene_type:complete
MRRSASEVIKSLESRINRLENKSSSQNKSAKLTLEKELRELNDHLKAINKMIKAYEVFEDLQITFGAFFSQDLAGYIGNNLSVKAQYKFYDGVGFFTEGDALDDLDGFLEVLEKTKNELENEIKELKRNPPVYV